MRGGGRAGRKRVKDIKETDKQTDRKTKTNNQADR